MRLKDLHETLRDDLRDQEFAAGYLQVALSEGLPAFLVARRDVVQANEGVTRTAQAAGVGRESLYKTLSENGNPQFSTIHAVLQSLGLQVSITPNL